MILGRRGFTVVEALLSIVISTMLVSASLAILVSNQRLADAVSGRVSRQDQLRAAVDILTAEVRQIDPADGDLASTSPDTLLVRSVLGAGVACAVSYTGTPTATLRKLGSWIQPGDSMMILADNDPSTSTDDRWVRGVAGAVDTTQTCPTGSPAQHVTLSSMAAALAIDSIRVGAAARSFQWRGFALGLDNGSWYLTLKTPDMLEPEPVAGPFGSPTSSGLRIGYFDVLGQPTVAVPAVRQFEVSVKTIAGVPGGPDVPDSLMAWVRLP
jgi:hypothetical protein